MSEDTFLWGFKLPTYNTYGRRIAVAFGLIVLGHPISDTLLFSPAPVYHPYAVQPHRLLGLGRTAAYDAARRGELPTRRLGRRLLVPVPALLEWLGAA